MTNYYSGPKALTEYILYQSKQKGKKTLRILMVQGILAGLYIAIGAIAYLKLASSMDHGIGSFLGALVFPFGIIAILLMQAELFTSDSMVMVAVYDKRTKFYKTIGILTWIIIANLIGAIAAAALTSMSGIFGPDAIDLVIDKAVHKASMPMGTMFASAIFCNILVCTSVCLAYSCKDEIAKLIVIWLGITVFVLSGTEHVVANMYYLFAGYFFGAQISLLAIFRHLAIVAIGNFIGGGIIVSGVNYLLAYRDIDKNSKHITEK